jgi:hypothetical protein
MRALNINASQVYSIEYTHWMYLWPLLTQKCVYFHMNSKYTASNTLKTTGATSSAPMVVQTPVEPEMPVAPEPPTGVITGNMDADFNACDDLMRMERSQCRKKVYNYYRNLKKQKK